MCYCFGGGRCSGALGGASLLPLQHQRLLAGQDGAGSVDGGHVQAREVVVLGIVCRMLLRMTRAFLLMVVHT